MSQKYWYDTEFLENGRTINLISIGIVAEDGREYYAVNKNMPWDRILRHKWLATNVVPFLPTCPTSVLYPRTLHSTTSLDIRDKYVKTKNTIAMEVDEFLTVEGEPELWAWYGAYDHVTLMQLWGPMIARPALLPMYTNDLRQVVHMYGMDDPESRTFTEPIPSMPGHDGQHHALHDARETKWRWNYVREQTAAFRSLYFG